MCNYIIFNTLKKYLIFNIKYLIFNKKNIVNKTKMGLQNCKTAEAVSPQAHYYFKQIQFEINAGQDDANMKETCKIEVKINNMSSGSCKVGLIQYTDSSRKTILKNEGETEYASVDSSTNSIIFNKFYILNYFFEKEQPIDFIISGSINGKVSTTLPSIMGSRGQRLIKPIEGGGDAKLEVKGFSYKAKESHTFYFRVGLKGMFNLKGINYRINYMGNMNRPQNIMLYRSEILNPKMTRTLEFGISKIPDLYITPDQNMENNLIEVAVMDPYHNKVLGRYNGPISGLLNVGQTIQLGSGGNTANISIEKAKNYTFLDYLRGGMQINLTVAIDFTGSNGDPTKPFSLHYLGTNGNSYEVAISSCGNIVAYYDYDQLFPAFGFGGKFCGDNNVSHCFPLNMNPNNPDIQGIDGILQAYRNILNQTKLYGPTYFHYIIDQVISVVKQDVIAENKMNYNILMILTDGIIDDMDQTIDSLVEASFLSISVIIIGIGDADFSNMDILDADDDPLVDKNGRKADRDLVQFVPFKKYSYNGQLLAQEVLEEIPRQVIEYYQHQKMPPREPVFNI